MRVRTKEQKKIDDLLYVALSINQRIVTEIGEIQRGAGRPSKEILEGLLYIIEDRFNFMIKDEEEPE